jgi:hypothetical protein
VHKVFTKNKTFAIMRGTENRYFGYEAFISRPARGRYASSRTQRPQAPPARKSTALAYKPARYHNHAGILARLNAVRGIRRGI